MIPKIFHRIWLGNHKMPREFVRYGKSWEDLHPNWEMNLWTDDNLPELINQAYLDKCNTYSEMSDLIRYELLFQYGGIYLDCDFECFKNIEPIIKNSELFISTEDNRHLCGGFIGSIPQHFVIKRLIDEIPSKLKETEGNKSDLRSGPTFVTKTINRKEINILPKQYFYPYLPGQTKEKKALKTNRQAYAAHHWAGSWLKNKVV
jgi:mannosyltransferase OCH1-like enzyme